MWFGGWLCSPLLCVQSAVNGRPCRFSHCCDHLCALLFVFFDLTLIISVFFGRITIHGTVLVSLERAYMCVMPYKQVIVHRKPFPFILW